MDTPQTVSFRAAVLVFSDRASSGTYEDRSGPAIVEWLKNHSFDAAPPHVLPDDSAAITEAVLANLATHDFVVCSGGTGITPRDVTPQTLARCCDYEIPGFGELLRRESMKITSHAAFGRGGAWVKHHKLILALPGNPKAVTEQLDMLRDILTPALFALKGQCRSSRGGKT